MQYSILFQLNQVFHSIYIYFSYMRNFYRTLNLFIKPENFLVFFTLTGLWSSMNSYIWAKGGVLHLFLVMVSHYILFFHICMQNQGDWRLSTYLSVSEISGISERFLTLYTFLVLLYSVLSFLWKLSGDNWGIPIFLAFVWLLSIFLTFISFVSSLSSESNINTWMTNEGLLHTNYFDLLFTQGSFLVYHRIYSPTEDFSTFWLPIYVQTLCTIWSL